MGAFEWRMDGGGRLTRECRLGEVRVLRAPLGPAVALSGLVCTANGLNI